MKTKHFPRQAFSLLELLVVIVVLGVVLYFAFPNIVQMRRDSEDNLARARAEALNMAAAAYFQAVGSQAASSAWSSAGNNARYALVSPYLAFAAPSLSSFMPAGYSATFSSDPLRQKVAVQRGSTSLAY